MTHVSDIATRVRNPKDHAELDLAIVRALRPFTMTPLPRGRIMQAIGLEQRHGADLDKAMQRLRKQGLVEYKVEGEATGWVYVVPPGLKKRFAP